MLSYKKLGFVNTRALFKKALSGGYAVPAYNFNNLEGLQAIVLACLESQSPVILQASKSACNYVDQSILPHLVYGAVLMMKRVAKEKKLKPIPVVLHLDHGPDFKMVKQCIDSGFSSVMIDGSSLKYKDNVALTKKVVDYAHKYGVTVEGELGELAGVEDDVVAAFSDYTNPKTVADFVLRTGVDSLAVSIGTSHGVHKFKPGVNPHIRLDILKEIEKQIPNFPIVLHGASSVPHRYVGEANKYGANLIKAIGVPEDQLRVAAGQAVCKINIDSDSRLITTATLRKIFAENKTVVDPREYLGEVRDVLKEFYINKNKIVMGSNDRV